MVAKDNAIKAADWLLAQATEHGPEATSYDGEEMYFEDHIIEHGFERLGAGYFGAVFEHPHAPGFAIKVCVRNGDSSPAYLAWARANPGPHIPRVHYLKRCGHYVVAVLDKMKPMGLWSDNFALYEQHMDRDLQKISDHPLNAAGQRIRKFFEGACDFDCHKDNVMVDINNQLVITDPVSFSDNEKSRAMRTGIERALDIAA